MQGLVTYQPRGTVLTQSYLVFYEADSHFTTMIEQIPLVEIFRLSSKFVEDALRAEPERGDLVKPVSEADSREMLFVLRTLPGGSNFGRNYALCCQEAADFWEFYRQLEDAIYDAKKENQRRTVMEAIGDSALGQFRHRTNLWYESFWPQTIIGVLIFAAFGVDVSEAELLPPIGSREERLFESLSVVFAIIFTLELAVNLFARADISRVSVQRLVLPRSAQANCTR